MAKNQKSEIRRRTKNCGTQIVSCLLPQGSTAILAAAPAMSLIPLLHCGMRNDEQGAGIAEVDGRGLRGMKNRQSLGRWTQIAFFMDLRHDGA